MIAAVVALLCIITLAVAGGLGAYFLTSSTSSDGNIVLPPGDSRPANAVATSAPGRPQGRAPIPPAAVSTRDATPDGTLGGVHFGDVVVLDREVGIVGALVSNAGDQVVTFVAAATFTRDGDTVAIATGVVQDLRPNETRAALMVSPESIGAFDAAAVEIRDVLIRSPTSQNAKVAENVGLALVDGAGGQFPTTVEVRVTNGNDATYGLTIQAAAIDAEKNLIGIALGGDPRDRTLPDEDRQPFQPAARRRRDRDPFGGRCGFHAGGRPQWARVLSVSTPFRSGRNRGLDAVSVGRQGFSPTSGACVDG